MRYILSLDQGTTSSRAVIFGEDGAYIFCSQFPLTQHYPQPGWVEHDPAEILSTELRAVSDVLSKLQNADADAKIEAVGVTNQRETAILWDATTGKAIAPAIVWQCRRTAPMVETLEREGCGRLIREKTGLFMDAYFSGTKVRWLTDNVLGGKANVGANICFGTVDSFLIWNLTGGAVGKFKDAVHVSDYSNASRTMLFDIHKRRFDSELCEIFGVPEYILPRTFSGCEVVGHVASGIPGLELLAGVPIAGSAGDQAAALFGQCAVRPGMAKNTYGTGCFTLMNTGEKPVMSSHGLLTSVAWELDGKPTYAAEGSAFNAGAAIQWLRDGLGLIKTAHECDILAESATDNGGVYLVPAFTGLGAPYWDMHARGILCGLTRGTTRAHIARATLEAIAYQVTDLVETMQLDTGVRMTELRVDGGASVSDFLMQFQADMLALPVDRPAMVETTAAGAAYLAGIGVGMWDLPTVEKLRKTERVFTASMSADERYELYRGWKSAVSKARLD